MKRSMLVLALMASLGQWGCEFVGGAAAGAVGTSAAYEINAHHQMSKLEDDYQAKRISSKEYETRKAQIARGSIIY
jgi:hypothetical protein